MGYIKLKKTAFILDVVLPRNSEIATSANMLGHSLSKSFSAATSSYISSHSVTEREIRTNEARSLLRGIGMDVQGEASLSISKIAPSTLIGHGAIRDLVAKLDEIEANTGSRTGLVFVDTALTPLQQRNLERELSTQVHDRTQVILSIFAARARTHEGRVQVDLAREIHARSRLVRTWTHLERQRGGRGFLTGPGEKQLEVDRRQADQRIRSLRKRLTRISRSRVLHRARRQRTGTPIVALAGYTNAGKSTLFARLTDENVLIDNRVFATLDPTVRKITVGNGRDISLVDTVGFISDLPSELIASFHATLEEIVDATLILHVHDVSSAGWENRCHEVDSTLERLGVDPYGPNVAHALNKIDNAESGTLSQVREFFRKRVTEQTLVPISAITAQGLDSLIAAMRDLVFPEESLSEIIVPESTSGEILAWLHRNCAVLETITDDSGSMRVSVQIAEAQLNRLRLQWPNLETHRLSSESKRKRSISAA